jgi:hypothetical protein
MHCIVDIRIETFIQAAIRVQAADMIARGTVQFGEGAPDQDPAIRLYRQGNDQPIRARVKGGIQAAIRIQAPDISAGETA